MSITIDQNTLFCVIVISSLILIIVTIVAREIRYHTKRKFDSIEEYNKLVVDKLNSYKENQKQYYKNVDDINIKNNNNDGIITKIIKIYNTIRGSE